MAASITPVSVATATAPVSPVTTAQLTLQPGTVVSAQVMQLLENGLAQIAIDGLAIAALSEVPLQVGDQLKLAVSQATDGVIKLSIVPQGTGVPADASVASAGVAVAATGSAEAVVVAVATQAAAPRQQSLSPLFANLPVVVASDGVPPAVQAGASQLLALRPALSEQLSASDLRTAFDQSGLFLEATLASGAAPAPSTDLKAALVTFRDVVSNWLAASGEGASVEAPLQGVAQGTPMSVVPQVTISNPAVTNAASATLNATQAQAVVVADAATLVPATTIPEVTIIASNVAAAASDALAQATPQPASPQLTDAGAPTITSAVQRLPSATNLIIAALEAAQRPLEGEALRGTAQPAILSSIKALQAVLNVAAITRPPDLPAQSSPPAARAPMAASTPAEAAPSASAPPPFRGAAPAAQPIAQASIAPEAAPKTVGQHLLEQTDGAIARQTLLQVASLPDRVDSAATQFNAQLNDTSSQRWNFEIPFNTAQGTALAQFEIERDGGGNQVEASSQKVWRARFTLDIEPTGPIHALVSLVGDKTAVRMWAERPETTAQIRARSGDLMQALRRAELEPGDIVISSGAPPQGPAKAGHFLDRAS
jgi:flagellar hook-length control protein FliK